MAVPDAAPHTPGAAMAGPTPHRRPPALPLGGPRGGIPRASFPLSSHALPGAPMSKSPPNRSSRAPSPGSACAALMVAVPETLSAQHRPQTQAELGDQQTRNGKTHGERPKWTHGRDKSETGKDRPRSHDQHICQKAPGTGDLRLACPVSGPSEGHSGASCWQSLNPLSSCLPVRIPPLRVRCQTPHSPSRGK